MAVNNKPVLVLGGGINGAAIARELLLNDIPVWLVDQADIASGTTAYSSRLIHGGLRYLEGLHVSLVRESLRALKFHSCHWANSQPINSSFLPGWPHMKP